MSVRQLLLLFLQIFAHLQVTTNYLAHPAVSNECLCGVKRLSNQGPNFKYSFFKINFIGNEVKKNQSKKQKEMLVAVITCFSVMPLLAHVSVKIDGGLPQQTVARTVWLLSGTHLQRKTVKVTVISYVKHLFAAT